MKLNNCLFLNNRRNNFSLLVSIFIILFIVIMLFIVCFVKFDFISSHYGIVCEEDGAFYVYLVLDDNGIEKIPSDLVVNGVKLDYQIFKISDYVFTDFGLKRQVYLNFDIDDKDKIINNVLKVNFVYKKTFFDFLKERLA